MFGIGDVRNAYISGVLRAKLVGDDSTRALQSPSEYLKLRQKKMVGELIEILCS